MKYLLFTFLISGLTYAKCELRTNYETNADYNLSDVIRENGTNYNFSHKTTFTFMVDGLDKKVASCSFKNRFYYTEDLSFKPFPQINKTKKNTDKFYKDCQSAVYKVLKKAEKFGCSEFERRVMESNGLQGFSNQPGTVSYQSIEAVSENKVRVRGILWLDEVNQVLYPIANNSDVDGICRLLGYPGGERHDAVVVKYMMTTHPMAFSPKVDVNYAFHRIWVGSIQNEIYRDVYCQTK